MIHRNDNDNENREVSNTAKVKQLFGVFHFFLNSMFLAAFGVLIGFAFTRNVQFTPGFFYLAIPPLGVLSVYWILRGQRNEWRRIVVTLSLVCSIGVLSVACSFGPQPQLNEVKAAPFESAHAEQDIRNDEKNHKLLLGAYEDDIDIVKAQLALGADINVADETGDTALHVVRNADIAKLLITQGADINARNDRGETPLFNKEIAIAELLLDAGADIEAKNKTGNTPLLLYVYAGYLDGIKYLLARSADVNACNHDHHNARDIAAHFHPNTEVLRFLESLDIRNCR